MKEFSLAKEKIIHFRRIKIKTDHKEEFQKAFEEILNLDYTRLSVIEETLKSQGIDAEMIATTIHPLIEKKVDGVKLRKLMQHFYIPIVFSNKKVDWIKHIINVKSEAVFIERLLEILDDLDKHYDWRMFSKLDEKLDNVYIPYLQQGKIKKFVPDFIFWLFKGDNCVIHFINPKGTGRSEYQLKVDGYEMLFTKNGEEKIFEKDGIKVKVKLHLYTEKDLSTIGEKYRDYWLDTNNLLQILISY